MYKLTDEGYAIKGDVRFSIIDSPDYPNDSQEYLDYIRWINDGGVPDKSEQEPESRKIYISERLSRIDEESVRPIRAKISGSSSEYDDEKLAALDAEASALRAELKGMTKDTAP